MFLVKGSRKEVLNKIPIEFNLEKDPKTYSEAMASRDFAFWKKVINDEMDSLMSNAAQVLVDPPLLVKSIGYKWSVWKKI